MVEKYSSIQIEASLVLLNEQTDQPREIKKRKLHKVFVFPDFASAFGFMASVAICAEKAGHHPEWFNVYYRVEIDLITHDVKGISQKDFELAGLIEKIVS